MHQSPDPRLSPAFTHRIKILLEIAEDQMAVAVDQRGQRDSPDFNRRGGCGLIGGDEGG
jgi:hypothetical protein